MNSFDPGVKVGATPGVKLAGVQLLGMYDPSVQVHPNSPTTCFSEHVPSCTIGALYGL